MKQVLIRKGEVVVEQIPPPVIERDSVLVEVNYSLISTGTELAGITSSGKPLWQRALSEPENVRKVLNTARTEGLSKAVAKAKGRLDLGYAAGYSCSGVVIAVGDEIDDVKGGDRVACVGGGVANHAEIACVPHNLVARVPDNLDLKEAASVALGSIAMQGIRRAAPTLGETVAVIGLGLVGQLTAQMLKVAGCSVIGVDLVESRVTLAQSLGVDYAILGTEANLVSEILHYTSGLGADATIITAATKSNLPLQQSMEITRKKGRVVVVGDVGLHLNRSPFYEKEIDLLISCSYGPGRYDETYERKGIDYPYAYVRWTENRNMQEYLHLLSEGKVNFKALISKEYSVDDAPLAYRELREDEQRPIAMLLRYLTEEKAPSTKLERKVPVISKALKKEGLINVALVGAGAFAKGFHLPNLKRLHHLYDIYAIVSATGINAKETARRFGANYCTTDYYEVLNDDNVDMVLITTRHNLHAQMAMEAAKAGKAIFLEKPMALNKKELDKLVTVLQETQVPFMVGFNRRFSPCAVRAKEVISKRQNPIIVNYRVNAGYIPLDHWVHTREGGGRIIGEACHMFDLLNYFTESPMESVMASAITPKTPNISSNDNFTVTLKYQDGSICTLTFTALGAEAAGKEYIEIYADSKTMIIDDFKNLRVFGTKARGVNSRVIQKGHLEELAKFAKCIKGQGSLPIPFEHLVSATAISFQVDNMVKRGEFRESASREAL